MAASKRRKQTERGIGETGGSLPPTPAPDDAGPPSESRAPRRATLEQGFARPTTRTGIAPPALPVAAVAPPSTRGVSVPPPSTRGRYSQQPGAEEAVAEASPTRSLPSRQPPRVDVRPPKRSTPAESPGAVKPRIVGWARIAGAPLTSREAFVLGLIDGATTVQDLVDAAGISEAELMAILASLTRLGIIATTSAK